MHAVLFKDNLYWLLQSEQVHLSRTYNTLFIIRIDSLKPMTRLIVLFTLHFPLSTPENLNAADQFFSLFNLLLGFKD